LPSRYFSLTLIFILFYTLSNQKENSYQTADIYLNETRDGLICGKCCLIHEIKDDIPIMLIEEAKPFSPD